MEQIIPWGSQAVRLAESLHQHKIGHYEQTFLKLCFLISRREKIREFYTRLNKMKCRKYLAHSRCKIFAQHIFISKLWLCERNRLSSYIINSREEYLSLQSYIHSRKSCWPCSVSAMAVKLSFAEVAAVKSVGFQLKS